MKSIFIGLLLASTTAFGGGDRIGNGGGLWSCEVAGEMRSGMLVDLYEAVKEFELTIIPNRPTPPMEQVTERMNYFRQAWPELMQQLAPSFEVVLKNKKETDERLAVVDDALNRFEPNPANCFGGEWKYRQFANFTENGPIWISRQLWNSPVVPNLHKAALIWHEAVYHHMRTRFGDKNSSRTRQIVGLLFADENIVRVKADVTKLMQPIQQPPTPPPTTNPNMPMICLVQAALSGKIYVGAGRTTEDAIEDAGNACAADMNPMVCAPRPNPRCERADSENPVWTCTVRDNFFNENYQGAGRNRMEAEFQARQQCRSSRCSAPTCDRTGR